MTRFDMFQKACEQLGNEPQDDALIDYFQRHFRVALDPKFIPILRATRRGQDALRQSRQNAAHILAEIARERQKGPAKNES
jgi:hypothetical protein